MRREVGIHRRRKWNHRTTRMNRRYTVGNEGYVCLICVQFLHGLLPAFVEDTIYVIPIFFIGANSKLDGVMTAGTLRWIRSIEQAHVRLTKEPRIGRRSMSTQQKEPNPGMKKTITKRRRR